MELNIRKRGSVWEYRFEIAKVDGKRKQVSKSGFKTKREATEAGTKALGKYNNSGVAINESDVSLADYLDYWLDTYGKMNLKYNTQLNYLYIIENHLKPNLGSYRLKSLSAATIQEYANALKLRGLSRSHCIGIIQYFVSGSKLCGRTFALYTVQSLRQCQISKIHGTKQSYKIHHHARAVQGYS